jgi:methylmalonyl-CoA mutase N-terminal domain/subunit
MNERFGVTNPDARKLRFHTQTAGSTLTAQQPHNNIVRVAFQALAAVLGGAQSLHTNSMDEALSLPTEDAVRIALRTQQVLAEETGAANTVDPLGGAYLIEHLTEEIESRVRAYLDKIDRRGGALAAVESGYIDSEIQEAAYRYQREVEEGDQILVGVNAYQMEEDIRPELQRMDRSFSARQQNRLKKLRDQRNQKTVDRMLKNLQVKAEGTENLMPRLIECVEANATLGEIVSALKQIWGEYLPGR